MHNKKIGCFFVLLIVFVWMGLQMYDKADDSLPAFQQRATQNAEEHAEALIHALYGSRVTFRKERGDSTNFTTRYYCSNVCIDACADGSVRYLCDIRSAGGEDPLLMWLFEQDEIQTLYSQMSEGIEFREVQSNACIAEICVNRQTGRVFAAKIIFFS